MPAHESPPPSVRILDPAVPSRPTSPGSASSQRTRPSLQLPSRVTSQLGLDPQKQSGYSPSETKQGKSGSSPLAGWNPRNILNHRWFSWIVPNLQWTPLKPVIRCAAAAWVGWVIQLIQPSQAALGQAAFFVLIVAFIIPPHQPVVQVLESLANMYFFAGLSWAWASLGIFVAHVVRDPVDQSKVALAEQTYSYASGDPAQYQRLITYAGTYIQAKSSVVLAVWLAVGSGGLLWYKLRTQPSPATFPIVLACILMDIASHGLPPLVFLPNPYYTAGLLFFLPMAVQGGLAVIATLCIFPRSVSSVFQSRFAGILTPLCQGFRATETFFMDARTNALPEDLNDEHGYDLQGRLDRWASESGAIRTQLLGSLSGVAPLRALVRYLPVDISYNRLSTNDLKEIFEQLVLLQIRSAGLGIFYDVISSNARHSHLDSAAFNAHSVSRPPSRATSVVELSDMRNGRFERSSVDSSPPSTPLHDGTVEHHSRHLPFFTAKRSSSPMRHGGSRPSHTSLLEHLRRIQQPVGVYESQRYMDIEKAFSVDTESVIRQLDLMADAALPVVKACRAGLEASSDWLANANRPRHLTIGRDGGLQRAIVELEGALTAFKTERLQILMPFRHLFDPNHPPIDLTYKMSYRGLFQNFVAEYHVMEFAHALLATLTILDRLDTSRPRKRFWYPRPMALWSLMRRPADSKEEREDSEEDGPVQDGKYAFHGADDELLGEVRKRNPENTPFDNRWLNALSYVGRATDVLHSRSFWYAIKAGAITTLAALPGFVASSANFYYLHRGVWVLIMAQLTLAAYSGDTTSAFIARLVASFWGCISGMTAWYIGSGSGRGNPFGLAAVAAVTFPIAMFFRIHFPGAVLTAVFGPVTFGLVLGYSYLNATLGSLTEATWGWDVAWRRFLSVSIGITAAWIFAYLPPSFSTRRAIRYTYSRSIIATGVIFCDILSDANGHHSRMYDNPNTKAKLLTWRSKLNAMKSRHQNALHEYSFKGRWPEERYTALQSAISDLLALMAQLRHVYLQLDRPWRKALLERTRLNDLRFLGDVLAVLNMSATALRSGTALPQITPSPLVERFRRGKYKGIQLPESESSEIPTLVTVEVLESDEYMRFAVGVTTTFSIMARLDRIVVICKTLLGESFHISGLHYDADTAQV